MMNLMVKIIVNNVFKLFENVNCIVFFFIKKGIKKYFVFFMLYYLFIDKVKIVLNFFLLFGNVFFFIFLIVIFINFKFVVFLEFKKVLMFFFNNFKVLVVKVLSLICFI